MLSNQPSRAIDPRLGPVVESYPLPGYPRILFSVGLVTALGGAALCVAAANALWTDPRPTGDDLAMAGVALGFLAVGAALAFIAGRILVRKPIWHLCTHGMVCTYRSGGEAPIFWSSIPRLVSVRRTTNGVSSGFHLEGAGKPIEVPNEATAERAQSLWHAARRAAS